MIGSPNHVFFVHDGDDSDRVGAGPGPLGSDRIEKTFQAFFAQRGLPTKGADLSGRSDYAPFVTVGIPSGGLFSGADGKKTAEEAKRWGGRAGQPYDPCYHQACDTAANTGNTALDVNSDALGFAVLQYAMNTSDINGIAGDPRFPPVGPDTVRRS
jgi:Zn-dependent M28 family amino/carboxypeptidase